MSPFYCKALNPFLKKKNYLSIFRERGREGKIEEEKHQCVVTFCALPSRGLARNPGMCPRLGIELATLRFTGPRSIH